VTQPKIIIVDDSPSVRALARRGFERVGFTVFDTDDGAEALATVLNERPDVMLLDLTIPGLSIPTFISELRALREIHELRLKLLLYSGRLPEELRDLCRRYGADGYVQKGYRIHHCVAAVNAVLPHDMRASAYA